MVEKWVALMMCAVALAGCADEAPAETQIESREQIDSVELEQGKGAISGLLVDDRFRPIVGAGILLQQTAGVTETNENGEFFFLDLEPGTYTLRVNAEGHEGVPERVTVDEGLFAEAQLLARRISNSDGVIITEDLAAFVACNINTPPGAVDCGVYGFPPDLSGDTRRSILTVNYEQFGHNITYWVVEMMTDKPAERTGAVKLITRQGDNYFVNDVVTEGSYLWTKTGYNQTSPNDVENRNHPFTNDGAYSLQLWAQGLFKEETQSPGGLSYDSRGVGVQLGLKANIISSLFLYDPEIPFEEFDMDDYCTMC